MDRSSKARNGAACVGLRKRLGVKRAPNGSALTYTRVFNANALLSINVD
jgi:hypothetical protein